MTTVHTIARLSALCPDYDPLDAVDAAEVPPPDLHEDLGEEIELHYDEIEIVERTLEHYVVDPRDLGPLWPSTFKPRPKHAPSKKTIFWALKKRGINLDKDGKPIIHPICHLAKRGAEGIIHTISGMTGSHYSRAAAEAEYGEALDRVDSYNRERRRIMNSVRLRRQRYTGTILRWKGYPGHSDARLGFYARSAEPAMEIVIPAEPQRTARDGYTIEREAGSVSISRGEILTVLPEIERLRACALNSQDPEAANEHLDRLIDDVVRQERTLRILTERVRDRGYESEDLYAAPMSNGRTNRQIKERTPRVTNKAKVCLAERPLDAWRRSFLITIAPPRRVPSLAYLRTAREAIKELQDGQIDGRRYEWLRSMEAKKHFAQTWAGEDEVTYHDHYLVTIWERDLRNIKRVVVVERLRAAIIAHIESVHGPMGEHEREHAVDVRVVASERHMRHLVLRRHGGEEPYLVKDSEVRVSEPVGRMWFEGLRNPEPDTLDAPTPEEMNVVTWSASGRRWAVRLDTPTFMAVRDDVFRTLNLTVPEYAVNWSLFNLPEEVLFPILVRHGVRVDLTQRTQRLVQRMQERGDGELDAWPKPPA